MSRITHDSQYGCDALPELPPGRERVRTKERSILRISVRQLMILVAIPPVAWWATEVIYQMDRNRIKAAAYSEMARMVKASGGRSHPNLPRWEELARRYRRAMCFPWITVDENLK